MSTDDLQEQAAQKLLSGRDRIKAKAHGLTPVQAARRHYGDNALEAVEVALKDDRVAVTDDLLASVREDATAATADVDADRDSDGSGNSSAEILNAADYVTRRKKRRERVEASRNSQSDSAPDPNDIALAAMDGDDRVEANKRGQDPAEYVQSEYGLDPAGFDGGDTLNAAIMDQQSGGQNDDVNDDTP